MLFKFAKEAGEKFREGISDGIHVNKTHTLQ